MDHVICSTTINDPIMWENIRRMRLDEKTEWSRVIDACKHKESTLSKSLSLVIKTIPAVLMELES